MDTLEASVTDRLRQLLLSGEFPPGHHLQEIPIARRLGVSRTPVHTALATLAQEGLVIGRPKRGYVVRQVSLKEILDAYRVRGQLEALACRLLCEQGIPPATLAELRDCVEVGERILAGGTLPSDGLDPWRENNERFHRCLVGNTGNAVLIDFTARTLSLPLVSSRVVQWSEFEEIRTSQYHHRVITDAIAQGQADRAEAMMIEHVYAASERLRRGFT